MPVAKVGDINIYYEIRGEGEPLVLIMGLGGDINRWFRIRPVLEKEYKVIAFDNRGVGRTDKPVFPYTMEIMADDVAGLMDATGIKAAHIFGISLGGMIAQNFVLRHPDRVISLMLGCTFAGGTHSIFNNPVGEGVLNPARLEALSVEERAREMLPALYSQDFIDNNQAIIEQQVALSVANPIDPVGYTMQLEAVHSHDTYDRLPEINLPVLVIAGDSDVLIPAENSPIIARRIPGAELVLLEGMGHGFYTEARDETAGILMDFMKRNSPSGK
ncbi:alpha/beta fold hydrolase [Chloroflexota bacterium]